MFLFLLEPEILCRSEIFFEQYILFLLPAVYTHKGKYNIIHFIWDLVLLIIKCINRQLNLIT